MSTSTRTTADQATIDSTAADLIAGRWHARKARSQRSVMGYQPAISSRSWAAAMNALTRFAGSSDWAASVVFRTIGRVNLYSTPAEVAAQINDGLSAAARDGWHDVIGATGPEASRPSAHQHPTTLRQALLLALLSVEVEHAIGGAVSGVPGVGWAVQALLDDDEHGDTHGQGWLFPLSAAAAARR